VTKKIYDYNSSFSLIRTNPKLTGNVKITVDSDGKIWLNSFDSSSELSSNKFKRYRIPSDSDYALDLFRFFEEGQTPEDVVFGVHEKVPDDYSLVRDYQNQYDFFYGSGVEQLADPQYPEDYKYLAPIWLGQEIPEYFVIFQVEDPIDFPYNQNFSTIEEGKRYRLIPEYGTTGAFSVSYNNQVYSSDIDNGYFVGSTGSSSYTVLSGSGNVVLMDEIYNLPYVQDISSQFVNKILPKSKIVKTFDLSEGTEIGNYIRKITGNTKFTLPPISVSYNQKAYTNFNGISYQNGMYSSAGESLYDFFSSRQSTPQIDFDDFITNGFSRNGIIVPNLLNLEFLFSDTQADEYSINRYIGFYVNSIELGNMLSSGSLLWDNRNSSGNEPVPSRNTYGYYYDEKNFVQGNSGGVVFYYEGASGFFPGSNDVSITDNLKTFYLQDSMGEFHSLKKQPTSLVDIEFGPLTGGYFSPTGFYGATMGSLALQDTSVDLINLTGFDPNKIVPIYSGQNKTPGSSTITITIDEIPQVMDGIRFYYPYGSKEDGVYKYDDIYFYDLSTSLPDWDQGSFYSQDGVNYASTLGDINDVANSLSDLFNYISQGVFESFVIDNKVVLRMLSSGTSANSNYAILPVQDLQNFDSKYRGQWESGVVYSGDDIVRYGNGYWKVKNYNYAPAGYEPGAGELMVDKGITGNISSGGNYVELDNQYYPNWAFGGIGLSGNGIPDGTIIESVSYGTSVGLTGPWYLIMSQDATETIQNNYIKATYIPWEEYLPYQDSGYISINYEDASQIKWQRYFGGGTDGYNNRFYIRYDDKDKVKGQWIKGEFSNSPVIYINDYVDEPYYDAEEYPAGLTGFGEYLSVVVNGPNINLQISQVNSRVNILTPFRPSVGLLSFFDIKDFDFSFWNSEYGKAPFGELYRYYGLKPNVSEILESVSYYVARGPIIYNGTVYPTGQSFDGITGSNFYSLSQGENNPIVIPSWFLTEKIGTDSRMEEDLAGFPGFSSIPNLFYPVSPRSSSKIDLFTTGVLPSEYDYLSENYTKERAYISRVVPYVTKWGYDKGTDSRFNPYRLNSSFAFGFSNFSPFIENYSQSPKLITHEWYLLDQMPIGYPSYLWESSNSYLPVRIDLEAIKDANPDRSGGDYFTKYFTVQSSDYPVDPVSGNYDDKINTKQLFTILNYNPGSGFYEALFKGLKYEIAERSKDNPNNYLAGARKYENYKFSCVLVVEDEDDSIIQSPVKYEVIENETFGTITFVIKLTLKDYRSFSLDSILTESEYGGIINNSPVTGPSGAVIDYTLLYSLKSKKSIDYDLNPSGPTGPYWKYDTIKLSGALDLSSSAGPAGQGSYVDSIGGYVWGINNPEYDWDIRDEVNQIASSPTGGTGNYFIVPNIASTYPQPSGSFQDGVNFFGVSNTYYFDLPFGGVSPIYIPQGQTQIYEGNPVFQIGGGVEFFTKVMEKLSAAYVKDLLNGNSSYVKYKTYRYVNGTTVEYKDLIALKISLYSKIYKHQDYAPVIDENVPESLRKLQTVIGYNLVIDPSLSYELSRYGGGYSPIFKKIIKFQNQKNSYLTNYSDFDLSFTNCEFGPDKYNFGLIKDIEFKKVSKTGGILLIPQNSGYNPVYSLVDETTISRKDYSILSSSWDPGFLEYWINPDNYVLQAGTRNFYETKTFFGSKVAKLPVEFYSPTSISLKIEAGATSASSISVVNEDYSAQVIDGNVGQSQLVATPPIGSTLFDENIFPDVEVFYTNTSTNISGSLRSDRILRRLLLYSGLRETFYKYLVSDFGVGDFNSLEDDVKAYIVENLLNLYEVKKITAYVKKTPLTLGSEFTPVRTDLTDTQKVLNSYFESKDISISKVSPLTHIFNFRKDGVNNYSITFSFLIGRI
jgi:hypothetical protein